MGSPAREAKPPAACLWLPLSAMKRRPPAKSVASLPGNLSGVAVCLQGMGALCEGDCKGGQ